MIRVDDILLTVADQVVEPRWPIDLGELLFLPQTQIPEQTPGMPARPPFKYEFAPGTLYWPQGASRFALGQYVVTVSEANQIRALVLDDPLANALTLTLAGPRTGDDALTFRMHLLHILPLQYHYEATTGNFPPDARDAVYLLLLVDYRFFLQTKHPDWLIDDATTWDDLDADLETFLGDLAADAVPADFLQPAVSLAAPELASDGVIANAGYLIDAAALASGRRFVANRDGSFALQNWATALAAHQASQTANELTRRYGGDLAYPFYAGESAAVLRAYQNRHAFLVPNSLVFVFPEVSAGAEVAPYTSVVTFADVEGSVGWSEHAYAFREGDLRVATSLWNDGTNDADCDAYATAWAESWYAFLAAPELTCYSGVIAFDPDGFTDSTWWVNRQGDVVTIIQRGVLNPRPGVVLGYSGVEPPGLPAVAATIDVSGLSDITSTYVLLAGMSVIHFDETYATILQSPAGTADVVWREASSATGGVLTAGAQDICGEKTFTDWLTAALGADIRDAITMGPNSAPADLTGHVYATATFLGFVPNPATGHGMTVQGRNPVEVTAKASVTCSAPTGFPGAVWVEASDGGPNITGFVVDVAGVDLYSEGTNTPVYRHEGVPGDSGTDALGNVFSGGICTTVGAGSAGGVTSVNSQTGAVSLALDDLTDVAAPTPSDGQFLTFNSGSGDWEPTTFVVNTGAPAYVRAFRNAATGTITVNNATWTTVTLPSENYDTNAFHDGGGANPERLTIPTGLDGLYLIYVDLNPNYVGMYQATSVRIRVNGGTLVELYCDANRTWYISYPQYLAAGDYVDCEIHQASGGSLTFPDGGGYLSLGIAAFGRL